MNRVRKYLAPAVGFVAAATITACIIQAPPPAHAPAPAPSGQMPAEQSGYQGEAAQIATRSGVANGEYLCSFTSGQYSYPDFPCIVYARRDGRKVLEKVGGSQRIHGVIDETDEGFDFGGTFYCPHGSCTQQVSARFVAESATTYRGELTTQSGPIVVRLRFMPAGLPRGYGGYGYAGRRYGAGYGGRLR